MDLFFSFEGRIPRSRFWIGVIALVVVMWILMAILALVFGTSMMMTYDPNKPEASIAAMMSAMIPIGIISLISIWPSLAIYAKRWHDRNKSGWWSLIMLVPFIGGIWILVELGCLRGTDGPNDYGDDPLER